jgi:hypothetical protein
MTVLLPTFFLIGGLIFFMMRRARHSGKKDPNGE